MVEWLNVNGRTRILPSDHWYLAFANQLYPTVSSSALFAPEGEYMARKTTLALCLYLQDVIAQSGGWKAFTDLYYARYRERLPFYPMTEQYIPDEINPEDIALVLWIQCSRPATQGTSPLLRDPYDKDITTLAQQVYNRMDQEFEQAPINETPSPENSIINLYTLEIPSTPLPEITPETKLKPDVERCLAYSGGKPLLYFRTYRELCRFFVEVLKWEDHPSGLLPELEQDKEFVVYANAKGMLVAPGVAAYFCEPHNPCYDAARAADTGYEMFCCPGACPFDLLKYGMHKGLLPEVQFPFPQGKEMLHRYWDFIVRHYLNEYYESD